MSGHSKWSKVKHQKESTDATKGKIFTKIANAITIAVRQGGGITDPSSNFRLRLAIDKAKSYNIPKENINRSIEKATKGGDGEELSEVIYEAFTPQGVGLMIQAATDNKKRTVAEIKNLLERSGGVLATSGAVSHLFELVGQIVIKSQKTYDEIFELILESNALDLSREDDIFAITTFPNDLHKVKEILEKKSIEIISADLNYRAKTTVELADQNTLEKTLQLINSLEERDDVQKVFANLEVTNNKNQ